MAEFKTCPEGVDLIVFCEVTSKRAYEAMHARPTWPNADSGLTIGIGYDCGYHKAEEIDSDWPTLDVGARRRLATAAGVKGRNAKALADSMQDIVVPWDAAYATFRDCMLPKYERLALKTFTGMELLPVECGSALVSLVFNRGTKVEDDPDDKLQRRQEMKAIQSLIAAGCPEMVPGQLRSMKRLWPTLRGLRDRREAEAVLFEKGLDRRSVRPS
jgi:hypothetical protein